MRLYREKGRAASAYPPFFSFFSALSLRKKSLRASWLSCPSTPRVTCTLWLSLLSSDMSYREPHAPALGSSAPKYQTRDPRQYYGAHAHEARLERHIEGRVREPPSAELFCRGPYGYELGVGDRVCGKLPFVVPPGDDTALMNDDRTDRHLAFLARLFSLLHGSGHEGLVSPRQNGHFL